MAAIATVTIGGAVLGLVSGTKTLTGQITSIAAVGTVSEVTLTSGDNSITVPTGATGVLITPPSTNVATLKLKGNSGDTGVKLHMTFATWLSLDPTQTSFIVNASAGLSAAVEFNFV